MRRACGQRPANSACGALEGSARPAWRSDTRIRLTEGALAGSARQLRQEARLRAAPGHCEIKGLQAARPWAAPGTLGQRRAFGQRPALCTNAFQTSVRMRRAMGSARQPRPAARLRAAPGILRRAGRALVGKRRAREQRPATMAKGASAQPPHAPRGALASSARGCAEFVLGIGSHEARSREQRPATTANGAFTYIARLQAGEWGRKWRAYEQRPALRGNLSSRANGGGWPTAPAREIPGGQKEDAATFTLRFGVQVGWISRGRAEMGPGGGGMQRKSGPATCRTSSQRFGAPIVTMTFVVLAIVDMRELCASVLCLFSSMVVLACCGDGFLRLVDL